jgi:cysteine desulfurase family protein (TIGR01976 family)
VRAREVAADLSWARDQFPALRRDLNGAPCIFTDAPGGTQVPESVIDAISAYLRESNANSGGAFSTSEETDALIATARRAGAALLGCDDDEVVFGANMTSLAFALSRSLARELGDGDEVAVTVLDHDANVAPWVAAAQERGARVRWVDVDPSDCTLDLDSLDEALSERTRIVAFTLASNAVGTITAVGEVVARARAQGALAIADAVHLAPHRTIDVRSLGVDALFCSPYKFFGPHMGVMFGRRALLERLHPYKVRPAHDEVPDRWETGTKSHEALAGFAATVEYLAGLGPGGGHDRRSDVIAGMDAVSRAEAAMSARFLGGVADLAGARVFGIADPQRIDERTPTFALRLGDLHPRAVAEELGRRGIFVWDGNYYALAIMERLGLEATGGAVRVGFCHYNTLAEVDRVIEALGSLTTP